MILQRAAVIKESVYAARIYDIGRTGIVYLGNQDITQSTARKYMNPKTGKRIGKTRASNTPLRQSTNSTNGAAIDSTNNGQWAARINS